MTTTSAIALYVATMLIDGVQIELDPRQFAIAVGVLTVINLFIRPFIKLVLTPVIILTLGLGSLLVNAATLYILDFALPAVTIEGFVALALAALILGVVSMVVSLSAKIL